MIQLMLLALYVNLMKIKKQGSTMYEAMSYISNLFDSNVYSITFLVSLLCSVCLIYFSTFLI